MKKLSKFALITFIVFLLLVIASGIAVRPIYKALEAKITEITQNVCNILTEKTGLSVSYDSFSPSILNSFKIKKINLSDGEGNVVVGIKAISIKYKLSNLLKGDLQDFISSIVIDGVEVDAKRILNVVQILSEQNEKKEEENEFDIKQILNFVPVKIIVKNVHVFYDDEKFFADALIKGVDLKNSEQKDYIELGFKSKIKATIKDAGMNISGNIDANGTLYSNLDNSFLNLTLSDLNNEQYKINKLSLLATYKEKTVDVHTIQSVVPFFVSANVNLDTMDMKAGIKTENLNLLSLVTDISGKNSLSMLNNFRISINADATFNPNTNVIGYTSNGRVYISEKFFPGSANVSYNLSGNDKRIKVHSLNLYGPECGLNGNLDFTFATLSLGGYLNLSHFDLPNKKQVSTEIFIDPLYRGFQLFAPQVNIGDKTLTALQASLIPDRDSYDFDMEVSDYSDLSSGVPGNIKIEGSYLTKSNYAQANVTIDSLSIGSTVGYVRELLDSDASAGLSGIENFAQPYKFSGDIYVSSDLKSISYNVPYVIVANTTEDQNQYLFVSANGNGQSVQINKFNLIFGKYAVDMEGSFDMNPKTKDGYFMLDVVFSGIPYHLSGSIMPELITVNGDYGVNAEVRYGSNKPLTGELYIDSLPIVFDKINLLFSLDTYFTMDNENGPDVNVARLEIKDNRKGSPDEPKLLLTGRGTKYGAKLESIVYTDDVSAMTGYADASYTFGDNGFENLELQFNVENQLSDEEFILTASVNNPDKIAFGDSRILDSIYLDTKLDIKHFNLNRFMSLKHDDNEFSGSVSVTGPLSNPYGVIDIEKFSILLGNDLLIGTGAFLLEDKILSVDRFKINLAQMEIKNFSGAMDISTMTGKFNANIESGSNGEGFYIPLSIKMYDSYIPEGSFAPESFLVTISCDQIKSKMLKKKLAFDITASYSKDLISIFSSENLGLVGTFVPATGDIYGSVNSTGIMSFNLEGNVSPENLLIKLLNVNVNLKELISYVDVNNALEIQNGILKGSIALSGSFDTPEFRGALSITEPKIYIPSVFSEVLSTEKLLIAAANNELTLRDDTYLLNNKPSFNLGAKIFLDKWKMDSIEAKLTTLKGKHIPLKLRTPFVNISGEIGAELLMSYSDFIWDISGNVIGENISIVSNLSDITTAATSSKPADKTPKETKPQSKVGFRTDLNVILGTHVMLNFNPILRCIFAPNTRIGINMESESNFYDIQGGLKIKTGDISYLNRSFYIKDGEIKFNSSDLSNPLVNLRAETRERDSKGKNVTIILSAENQYLKDLNPRFTSTPAKSEREIMDLLGQIIVADADSVGDILISGADYAFQSTVIRGLENKLRDFMNFDIFSIRTNVVQNALDMGTSGNLSKDDISIGNFLDNSTVYMGKYLGSNLYVDALFAFSLENGKVTDPTKANGLLFQPEFGLELELPIANIRWNMAPDIKALMAGQYVPANSLSLSWDFKF